MVQKHAPEALVEIRQKVTGDIRAELTAMGEGMVIQDCTNSSNIPFIVKIFKTDHGYFFFSSNDVTHTQV